MRLLLASGGVGKVPERLEAWRREMRDFLKEGQQMLFIPYALADHGAYLKSMQDLLPGFNIRSIHQESSPRAAVERASAIFVGGGNTFRLLQALQQQGLLEAIRSRILGGAEYLGISAGSNIACPTIKTTNDMPIVELPSLSALGLIPFQLNPHYVSGTAFYRISDNFVPYGGETRDTRLNEFHEVNDIPVLALNEGAMLRCEGEEMRLCGVGGARLFCKGKPPQELTIPSVFSPAAVCR